MSIQLDLENINYVKITCKDKDGKSCVIKAAVRHFNNNEIFACTKFDKELYVPTPQEVNLSFICTDGLYFCNTELRTLQKEPPYLFFALKPPTIVEHRQQREFFREKIALKAIITLTNNNHTEHLTCNIFDISANGISVITDKKLLIQNDMYINILFQQKSVKAKIKYTRFDDENNILKTSFTFDEISESDRDFISQECLKTQLENKRKKFE